MKLLEPSGPTGLVARPGAGIDACDAIAPWRAARFDVLCAGEARPSLATGEKSPGFRPGGGAFHAALALARHGLRVGLAAAVADDTHGRALVAEVEAAGVDAGGVSLVVPRSRLVLASSGADVVPVDADDEAPIVVPDAWSADLLLVSGLSPALAPAAALCKAARAARRAGGVVIVDVNARPRLWSQRDPRLVQAVLREAHVVRCSTADLAALWIDRATLRSWMTPTATLVLTDGPGPARALGAFGEIVVAPRDAMRAHPPGAGDVFTAAICAAVLRVGDPGVERAHLWERILRSAHAAAASAELATAAF